MNFRPTLSAPSIQLSVVVPCRNEEQILTELHRRITNAITTAEILHWELILIDDGSTDQTWHDIRRLASRDTHVRGLSLSRNFGHQAALTAGLRHARGDLIFILDADLQDPPELLSPMLLRLQEGFDVVYGQRAQRAGETWFKRLTAHLFYRLVDRLSEVPIPRDTGDFRLMRRRVLDAFLSMPECHRFVRGMIAWAGFRQTAFLYDRTERTSGKTNYSLVRMLRLAADALTGFSVVPLRLCGLFGAAAGVLSIMLFAYALLSFFAWGTVRGWTSLAAIVTFTGAVQLLSLSLIGEYIGRAFAQSKKRPLYFVADSTNLPLPAQSGSAPAARVRATANPVIIPTTQGTS